MVKGLDQTFLTLESAMYKRVLLKLSGESLGGPEGKGLDPESLRKYSKEIARAAKAGLQIAIVNGGGNIFRGLQGLEKGFDRVEGDRMGMLATVINSLALSQFIKDEGVHAEVFSATPMEPLVRYYNRDNAVKVLEEGGVALIAGGTGSPFFTTPVGQRYGPSGSHIGRKFHHKKSFQRLFVFTHFHLSSLMSRYSAACSFL